jgi:hypothetical protein
MAIARGVTHIACKDVALGMPRSAQGALNWTKSGWIGGDGDILRVSANFDGIGRGPAAVNPHILADGPARLLQALQECPDASLKFRIVCCRGA